MSFSTKILFFFLLSISLKSTLTFGAQKPNTVYIITTNNLPKNNTNPDEFKIQISNSKQSLSKLETTLKWGGNYNFVVSESTSTYYLEALWGNVMASVNVFKPNRDIGHQSVFWLIKPNGFYLSWDNSTWVQKGVWETE
ncbi:hypothetical protein CsatB_025497 [Cannabis sativa]